MIGKIMSKYKIEKIICKNTSGVLYSATNIETDREVTLKIINANILTVYEEDLIRFRREQEKLKTIKHENLLDVIEYGEADNVLFIVMEKSNGKTLNMISISSINDIIKIIKQILYGIKHLHDNGAIHKSINSSSILNLKDGTIKIFDAGVSHLVELKKITEKEAIIGTFSYMSPESTGVLNRNIDERSDLYSLGVVAYELLTKVLSFNGENISKILHQQVATIPVRPMGINKNIPIEIDEIISKLLEKDPDLRYQSAKGLLYDLERYENGEKEFVVGENDPKLKISYKTRMIGREDEFDKIRALAKYAQNGQGNICLIAGEAGVGKSRFVEEVKNYVHANEGLFISGRCVNKENKEPYYPFKLAIDEYVKKFEKLNDDEHQKEVMRIKENIGDLGEIIVKINPEIKKIIGEQKPLIELDKDKENKRFMMVAADFFSKLVGENRLCLIYLDDLQWADDATLNLLREILYKIKYSNLLILGTYRDNEIKEGHLLEKIKSEAVDNKYSLITIELKKLNVDKIRKLISNTLGEREENLKELAIYIYDKSDGNPYFAINILHDLVSEKAIVFEKGSWIKNWGMIKSLNVSDTLVDMVLKRIEKITNEQKKLMCIASVIGREFNKSTIYELVKDLKQEEIIKILDQLIEIGLVEENKSNGNLLFVHDRVRDAFFILIDEDEKKETHNKIAKILERYDTESFIFDLLHHYVEAQNDDNVLKYIFLAAKKAKESYSNEDAIKYYEIGLKLLYKKNLGESKEWLDSSENLSEIYLTIGKIDETITICGNILEFKETKLEKAMIYRKLGIAYLKKGDFNLCEENLNNALKLLGEEIPLNKLDLTIKTLKELILRIILGLSANREIKEKKHIENKYLEIINIYIMLNWMYALNDTKKFVCNILRMINLSETKIGKSKEYSISLSGYASMFMSMSFFGTAINIYKRSLKIRDEFHDEQGKAQSYQFLGYCYSWKGEYEKSMEYFKKAEEIYKTIGDLWELCVVYQGYGYIYEYYGMYDSALKYFHMRLDLCKEVGDNYNISSCEEDISRCLSKKGLISEAEKYVTSSLEISKKNKISFIYCCATADYGILEMEKSNYESAISHLSEAKALYEKSNFLVEYIVFLYSLLSESYIELYRAEGNIKISLFELENLIKKSLSKTKRWPNHYGHALRIAGKFYALINKNKKAEKYFIKSINQTKKINRKIELAKGYFEYGLFLENTGRSLDAKGRLLEAYYIFKKLAIQKYLNILEEKLKLKRDNAFEQLTSVDRLSTERKMTTVLDTSRLLSSILDLNELLKRILDKAIELSGAERGLLLIKSDIDNALYAEVKRNISEEELTSKDFEISNDIIKKVENDKKQLLLANLDDLETIHELKNKKTEIKSIICVPVISKDSILGILYLDNRLVGGLFKEDELDVISLLSSQAGVSIENAKLFKKATIDSLTGIFNRAFLDNIMLKSVQETLRDNKKLSILMMDIDHFKIFNDTYGHQVGDMVLKEVASKTEGTVRKIESNLKYEKRKADFTARYGGEEFVVIFSETGLEGAVVAAERIRKSIEDNTIENIKENGEIQKLKVTVSIGVAELREGEDRIMLLKRADECMYKAKENGRNRVEY
ncbi:MAG TPA: hypothetical protein DEP72_08290 [Clostridiales bacterium]|nr:MAG: hypothetical protein A2Y18_03370 [Clostridiales bacterium GWD2_32_19]HCC08136.1 hypothetical protein [Clostridiales bacterium]